jgi:hypothetical protein
MRFADSATWQRLIKHGSHFCHPPTFIELAWNPQRCTLEVYSQLLSHSPRTPLWSHQVCTRFRHAFFWWTVRKPIDLDHLARKSGDNNGPEIIATAAFLEQNTFSRKLFHILACITVSWIVGILSRRRERRKKYVDGHCGKQIGPESDSC